MLSKLKKLQKHEGFMRYFNSMNWLFLEKIFRLSFSFLVGIYVARYLGPDNLGILSFSIVIIAILSSFIRIGLNNVVYKEFSTNNNNQYEILGTAAFLIFMAYLFSIVIFLIILYLGVLSYNNELLIVSIILVGQILLPFDLLNQFFMSKVESRKVAISGMISISIFSLMRVFLILYEAELYWFAISIVIELLSKYATLIFYYIFNYDIKKLSFSKIKAKKMLKASWPFIVIGLGTTVYTKIDVVMINQMVGNEAAGLYSIAMRLSDLYLFIPMTISGVLFVAISKAHQKSDILVKKRMTALYSFYYIIALIISFLMFLFSEILVITLFGDSFSESVPILKIYIWSIVFIFLQSAQNQYYIVLGLQHLTMSRVLQGAVVNVVLNYLLIHYLGAIGAAYSTVISYFYVAIFSNVFHKKTRDNLFLIINSIVMPWRGLSILKYFMEEISVKK